MEIKNNINVGRISENWKPLPNVAPDTLRNKVMFYLRLFFDLEVFTIYSDLKKELAGIKDNVLEIGCGLQPFRHLVPKGVKYYALDWQNSEAYFQYKCNDTIYYDGNAFPFKDETFGFIFHTEVLEHIYDLKPFLRECNRVMKEGGRMFFTVPFAARYHYIPHDYWRFTGAGLKQLLEESGFTDVRIVNRGSDINVALLKINAIFYRIIFKKLENPVLRTINSAIFALIFSVPIFCLTAISHISIFLKAGSPDDPLGYSVYCKK